MKTWLTFRTLRFRFGLCALGAVSLLLTAGLALRYTLQTPVLGDPYTIVWVPIVLLALAFCFPFVSYTRKQIKLYRGTLQTIRFLQQDAKADISPCDEAGIATFSFTLRNTATLGDQILMNRTAYPKFEVLLGELQRRNIVQSKAVLDIEPNPVRPTVPVEL